MLANTFGMRFCCARSSTSTASQNTHCRPPQKHTSNTTTRKQACNEALASTSNAASIARGRFRSKHKDHACRTFPFKRGILWYGN
eukprot:12567980-Alexandrium_andersonii.AAC.1